LFSILVCVWSLDVNRKMRPSPTELGSSPKKIPFPEDLSRVTNRKKKTNKRVSLQAYRP
jgi:hypothetical protein